MKKAFLSSTAKDLTEYREAAYKAIEGLDDWHCVRMEDFGARDAMADEFCQEKVAGCDVFVGIVGHCYGSSPKGSERSYTEQEYDAAIATDKPRLMFLAPEDFPLPATLIEPDERRAKQRAFRDRVNAERIRAPFTSPDALAWRIVQAIRNWERKATGIVQELFKSRVRIVDEALFQHPASEEEVSRYYDGTQLLTWKIVAAQGVIERDQQAELLERLITPSGQIQMRCIVGEAGAGKSSLAWQLARQLTHQQDNSILQILDNTYDDIWYRLPDFWTRIQQPFYVLVDDVFRDDNVLRALKGLDPNLPLTILTTSRTNEYRGSERFPFPVERVDLLEPSSAEKTRILSKLGKEWAQLTPEQRTRLGAANQFLVLMMELATGKELIEIIRDTLNRLRQQDEVVYRAYEYLCYTYQYDFSMPASLLERLDDKGRFYRLLDKKAARGLIFPDESRPGKLQAGHPLIAEHTAMLCGRDPGSVFDEILEAVNVRSWVERRFVAHLLREMARRGTEPRLTDILDDNIAVIEDIHREGSINEMTIWRALYQHLGRQQEAEQCADMALSKEPTCGVDLTTLIGLYRERGEEDAGLRKFQQWLELAPEDHHARAIYLGLVKREGTEEQVTQAIKGTTSWLAEHPQDNFIRQRYLRMVAHKGTDEQVAQAIEEIGAWLAKHPKDKFVRRAYLTVMSRQRLAALPMLRRYLERTPEDHHVRALYLGLVERHAPDQVAQVMEETRTWLAEHPQGHDARRTYLGLVERKGTDEQVAQAIEEIGAWLTEHLQDVQVRSRYLRLVKGKGTDEQVAQAIKETTSWLAEHPQDYDVRRAYLGLVERRGTVEQVVQATEEIGAWLAEHPQDTQVRRTYLRMVARKGTDEQVAQAIEEMVAWLTEHSQDAQVCSEYLGLVRRKGTDEQVAQMITGTTSWLAQYPQDYDARKTYLGLVERRGTDEQVERVIEETTTWLAQHPQDIQVRCKYLRLVERKGTDEQVAEAIEEIGAWLAEHPTGYLVRRTYLGLVKRKGTDEQVAQAITGTTSWLAEHPHEKQDVRKTYLSLVEHRGTDEQVVRVIGETTTWLAEHPQDVQVRRTYLGLVERKGMDEQVMLV